MQVSPRTRKRLVSRLGKGGIGCSKVGREGEVCESEVKLLSTAQFNRQG